MEEKNNERSEAQKPQEEAGSKTSTENSTVGNSSSDRDIIQEAKTENDRRERLIEEEKKLMDRKERLHAEQLASGRGQVNVEKPVVKDPKDYGREALRGNIKNE